MATNSSMSPTILVSSPDLATNHRPEKARPTGLPDVPKIFLNTTSRDKICLLPDQYGRGKVEKYNLVSTSACVSCSLPNLNCDPEIVLTRPPIRVSSREKPSKGDHFIKPKSADDSHRKDSTGSEGKSGAKLSVYCSPRVSRRGMSLPNASHNDKLLGEYSWLHNSEVAKYVKSELERRESNSSAESEGSLRSVSHMSTCATSDYSRFTSCDRLSLPVHDLSPNHPNPPGRLRRIYSNPEAPFIKESPPADSNQMRDSKSCSDLENNQSQPLVNHRTLERKLTNEGSHLLSPPPLLPAVMMRGFVVDDDNQWPEIGSPPPVDGWQETVVGGPSSTVGGGTKDGWQDTVVGGPSSTVGGGTKDAATTRDIMIRQWLQGVDPAIVVSQDLGLQGTVANSS